MINYCAFVLCLVFLLVFAKDSVAQQLKRPAPDFSKHSVVQPTVHHGRTKRQISSTRDTNGKHHSEVMISMEVDGEEYVLDLQLNQDLVTDKHVISYQKGGNTVVHKPKKEELDICQYSGTVRGKPDSSVAVSTCHGIRGVIFDDKRIKFIEPAQGSDLQSFHYIYDHSDYITNYRCGSDGSTKDDDRNSSIFKEYDIEDLQYIRANRYKRDASRSKEVHGPYNANSKSRYVELVLVVDKRGYDAISDNKYMSHAQRIRKIHAQMKDIANVLNSVYSPLNIFIALVGVEVWNEKDAIHLESDSERTLNAFLLYRRNKLLYTIPNDNAHLITRQKFKDGVVGKAYLRVMCTTEKSAGIENFHSDVLAEFALTIAHEMGHNFGMNHDESSVCKCPDDKCIMYPSTSSQVRHFSTCSLMSLALTFEKGFDRCLRNKPLRLLDSPTCGNGFVEAGEQCDCGLPDPGARSSCRACCHSDTCMLRHNATCGAGACCDLQSCRPRAAGSVCRAAERECDLPEYCTGHSEYCPGDVHKMDTTPCGKNDEAYCVRGSCRSRAAQCRLLWGMAATSCHDIAYEKFNIVGDQSGNCGHKASSLVEYEKCAPSDALCGSLQCKHIDVELRYGNIMQGTYYSQGFVYNNTVTYCTAVQIDLGLDETDAGMVPDGAKCGDEKMCLNQKCLSVVTVRADLARQHRNACPSDCSGHGICNSNGNCHCETGFEPPQCLEPGPASDPTGLGIFMVAMYIIFLGVVPLVVLVLLATHYWRRGQHKPYVPSPSRPRLTSLFTSRLSCTDIPAHTQTEPNTRSRDQDRPIYNMMTKIGIQPINYHKDKNLNIPEIKINSHQHSTDELKSEMNKLSKRKINKDDIRIVVASKDVKVRPTVKPKPVLNSSKENEPKMVIAHQGLSSTTNELIANRSHMYALNNVMNGSLYENVRPNAKVHKMSK